MRADGGEGGGGLRRVLTPTSWRRSSTATAVHVAVLAVLAYLPALRSAPDKIPADTKLYLYLDPARLIADAPWSWDTRQFGGWVPHQTLSYLWPSGPWYWAMERVGMPDWVAHRLWIGSILFVAGLGARWAAKQLGLVGTAPFVTGVAYMLTPFVLPYLSRTSLMLLPFASLGWLIGLTLRAAHRGGWRDIAWIGLVLATVGAPNATALAMIAPGPVLWLLAAAWQRRVRWKQAVLTAAKIGGVGIAVSLWWIVMLSIQGRHGADVLAYSESLEAVSYTSSSPEVLRGLGYWLFYVRDPFAFTTSSSYDYMASGALIAVTWVLALCAIAGLALTRWRERTFAIALVAVGVVLAVGVHPIANASPLMSPIADNSRSGLALAMRSSTRAVPMSALGMALGLAVLVQAAASSVTAAVRRRRATLDGARLGSRLGIAGAVLATLLVLVSLPPWRRADYVDPALEHDEHPPSAWERAADALDAQAPGYRVLQLPGAEFGAYRWGYTVDPPLPGLTNKPLITRDLLPLGSPAVMDLLYALDDRFQTGVAERSSVAPIARLLGADTVWVPGDVAFDRFRTPRPELTADFYGEGGDGLGTPQAYGEPFVNQAVVPTVDEQQLTDPLVGTPVAPVELVPVDDPEAIVRAKATSVLVAGSGEGLVDAAAAGLINGDELIRYAADLSPEELTSARSDASALLVTDSNRSQAHHWRSSQDVTGYTEDGTGGVLEENDLDQRLDVFPDQTTANQTLAVQRGPVTAAASAYGEPLAYRPEDRAAMAIDGDPSTAWVVSDRGNPIGQYLELTAAQPISTLRLVQPQHAAASPGGIDRWITELEVSVDGGPPTRIELSEASLTVAGQTITLPATGTRVRLEIAAVHVIDRPSSPGHDAVGFAEVDAGLGSTDEVVTLPTDALSTAPAATPLAITLTRQRVDATNRWRNDPERALIREFELATDRSLAPTVTARLSARAGDAVLADLFGVSGLTTASARIAGVPAAGGWAATDGDGATAWQSPFATAGGVTLTVPLTGSLSGPLTITQPTDGQHSLISSLTLAAGGATQTVAVPPPDAAGVSTIDIAPMNGDSVAITVDAVQPTVTIDRRFGEPTWLPVAINEIRATGITPATLPASLDSGCRDDLLTIDGEPLAVRIGGPTADLLAGNPATVQLCGGSADVDLPAGMHQVRSLPGVATGWDIDRVVLDGRTDARARSAVSEDGRAPVATLRSSSRTGRTIDVSPCPDGCWVVFGEGFNTGWKASLDGESLGRQQQVDGGFNGWWLPPSDQARTVEVTWTPQRPVTLALAASALAVLACIALIVFDRRRRFVPEPSDPVFAIPPPRIDRRHAAVAAGATAMVVALVVGPTWLPLAVAAGAVVVLTRQPRWLGPIALVAAGWVGVMMVWRVRREHPFADANWPSYFDDLHRLGLFAVVALLGSAFARER